MKTFSYRGVVICGFILLLGSDSNALAGDLRQLFGHGPGCACGQPTQFAVAAAPMMMHSSPMVGYGCACSAAVPSCCGVGGGISQLGNWYGFGGGYGSTVYGYGDPNNAYGGQAILGYGVPGGSGFTGFEGLPNMDGGGINHRYPYHSYRRPWAHPGPPSTNVNIVW